MRQRVVFFIDGFNLYHAIRSNSAYLRYKWINLAKLASLFITRNETIESIYYFTALATWSPSKVKKHKIFIRAQELNSVEIIYGEFKRRDKFCNRCNRSYQTFEEKQTDVNIAIELFKQSI